MSQIIATTLSNGSVSVPTATVVNGSAKAWVNFNGGGTIAARDSFNVASLTDNGTGDYTVNLTNSFDNANYAVYGNALSAAIAGGTYVLGPVSIATGSFRVAVCRNDENVSTATDRSTVTAAAHGDLA